MNIKKFTSLFTMLCFLLTFAGQNLAWAAPDASKKIGAAEFKKIFECIPKLPIQYGKVTGVSNLGSKSIVVNIQDLHCHPEAQKNISKIIEILDKNYKVSNIFVEGAYGTIDTSWLSDIQDKAMREEFILKMVETGRLNASEYYAVKNGKKDFLLGLEDKTKHEENIKRLGYILSRQEKYAEVLAVAQDNMHYWDAKYTNVRNKRFNRTLEKYRDGEMGAEKLYVILCKYINKINANPQEYNNVLPIKISNYPNIQNFMFISKVSSELDMKKVQLQLQTLLAFLKAKLPPQAFQMFLDETDNLSNLDRLAAALSNFSTMFEINLDINYKQLNSFFKLQQLSRNLNPLDLIDEERHLTERIRTALSYDQTEIEISFLNDFFVYFNDYLQNKLTADDFAYFASRFDRFIELYSKYAASDDFADIKSDFEILNAYYRLNDSRNDIFIANLLKNRDFGGANKEEAALNNPDDIFSNAQEIVIAVTGGYHSQGLRELLSKKGITDITITPTVTTEIATAESIYEEIIQQQSVFLKEALAFKIASQANKSEQFEALVLAGMSLIKDYKYTDSNIDELRNMLRTFIFRDVSFDKKGDNTIIKFSDGRTITITKDENGLMSLKALGKEKKNKKTVRLSKGADVQNLMKDVLAYSPLLFRPANFSPDVEKFLIAFLVEANGRNLLLKSNGYAPQVFDYIKEKGGEANVKFIYNEKLNVKLFKKLPENLQLLFLNAHIEREKNAAQELALVPQSAPAADPSSPIQEVEQDTQKQQQQKRVNGISNRWLKAAAVVLIALGLNFVMTSTSSTQPMDPYAAPAAIVQTYSQTPAERPQIQVPTASFNLTAGQILNSIGNDLGFGKNAVNEQNIGESIEKSKDRRTLDLVNKAYEKLEANGIRFKQRYPVLFLKNFDAPNMAVAYPAAGFMLVPGDSFDKLNDTEKMDFLLTKISHEGTHLNNADRVSSGKIDRLTDESEAYAAAMKADRLLSVQNKEQSKYQQYVTDAFNVLANNKSAVTQAINAIEGSDLTFADLYYWDVVIAPGYNAARAASEHIAEETVLVELFDSYKKETGQPYTSYYFAVNAKTKTIEFIRVLYPEERNKPENQRKYEIYRYEAGSKLELPLLRKLNGFLGFLGFSQRFRETVTASIELGFTTAAAYNPAFKKKFISWHSPKGAIQTVESIARIETGIDSMRAAMDAAWDAAAKTRFPLINIILKATFGVAGALNANIKTHTAHNIASIAEKGREIYDGQSIGQLLDTKTELLQNVPHIDDAADYQEELYNLDNAIADKLKAMPESERQAMQDKITSAFPENTKEYVNILINRKDNKFLLNVFNTSKNLNLRLYALLFLEMNGKTDIDTSAITREFKEVSTKFAVNNYFDLRASLMGAHLMLSSGLTASQKKKINSYMYSEGTHTLYSRISRAALALSYEEQNIEQDYEDEETQAYSGFLFTLRSANDLLTAAHEMGHNYLYALVPRLNADESAPKGMIHELFAYAIQAQTHESLRKTSFFNEERMEFSLFAAAVQPEQAIHSAAKGFIKNIRTVFRTMNINLSWIDLADAIVAFSETAKENDYASQSSTFRKFLDVYADLISKKYGVDRSKFINNFKLVESEAGQLILDRQELINNAPTTDNTLIRPASQGSLMEYSLLLRQADAKIAERIAEFVNNGMLSAAYTPEEIGYLVNVLGKSDEELLKLAENGTADIKHRLYAMMLFKRNKTDHNFDGLIKDFENKAASGEIKIDNSFDLRALLTGIYASAISKNKDLERTMESPEKAYWGIAGATFVKRGQTENIESQDEIYLSGLSTDNMQAALLHRLSKYISEQSDLEAFKSALNSAAANIKLTDNVKIEKQETRTSATVKGKGLNAILDRNKDTVYEMLEQGANPLKIAWFIAKNEFLTSLNPFRFIAGHTERDGRIGAGIVSALTYLPLITAGTLLAFTPVSAVLAAGVIVSSLVLGAALNLSAHTALDWRFIENTEKPFVSDKYNTFDTLNGFIKNNALILSKEDRSYALMFSDEVLDIFFQAYNASTDAEKIRVINDILTTSKNNKQRISDAYAALAKMGVTFKHIPPVVILPQKGLTFATDKAIAIQIKNSDKLTDNDPLSAIDYADLLLSLAHETTHYNDNVNDPNRNVMMSEANACRAEFPVLQALNPAALDPRNNDFLLSNRQKLAELYEALYKQNDWLEQLLGDDISKPALIYYESSSIYEGKLYLRIFDYRRPNTKFWYAMIDNGYLNIYESPARNKIGRPLAKQELTERPFGEFTNETAAFDVISKSNDTNYLVSLINDKNVPAILKFAIFNRLSDLNFDLSKAGEALTKEAETLLRDYIKDDRNILAQSPHRDAKLGAIGAAAVILLKSKHPQIIKFDYNEIAKHTSKFRWTGRTFATRTTFGVEFGQDFVHGEQAFLAFLPLAVHEFAHKIQFEFAKNFESDKINDSISEMFADSLSLLIAAELGLDMTQFKKNVDYETAYQEVTDPSKEGGLFERTFNDPYHGARSFLLLLIRNNVQELSVKQAAALAESIFSVIMESSYIYGNLDEQTKGDFVGEKKHYFGGAAEYFKRILTKWSGTQVELPAFEFRDREYGVLPSNEIFAKAVTDNKAYQLLSDQQMAKAVRRETGVAKRELILTAATAFNPFLRDLFIKLHGKQTAQQFAKRQQGIESIKNDMIKAWMAASSKTTSRFWMIRQIQRYSLGIAAAIDANIAAHVKYNLDNPDARLSLPYYYTTSISQALQRLNDLALENTAEGIFLAQTDESKKQSKPVAAMPSSYVTKKTLAEERNMDWVNKDLLEKAKKATFPLFLSDGNTSPLSSLSLVEFEIDGEKRRFLISSSHAVKDIANKEAIPFALDEDGRQKRYTRLFIDSPELDIAFLEVPEELANVEPLKMSLTPAKIGDKVFFFGYSIMGAEESAGSVQYENGYKGILTTLLPIEGTCGSAILNEKGEVIGIRRARGANVALAAQLNAKEDYQKIFPSEAPIQTLHDFLTFAVTGKDSSREIYLEGQKAFDMSFAETITNTQYFYSSDGQTWQKQEIEREHEDNKNTGLAVYDNMGPLSRFFKDPSYKKGRMELTVSNSVTGLKKTVVIHTEGKKVISVEEQLPVLPKEAGRDAKKPFVISFAGKKQMNEFINEATTRQTVLPENTLFTVRDESSVVQKTIRRDARLDFKIDSRTQTELEKFFELLTGTKTNDPRLMISAYYVLNNLSSIDLNRYSGLLDVERLHAQLSSRKNEFLASLEERDRDAFIAIEKALDERILSGQATSPETMKAINDIVDYVKSQVKVIDGEITSGVSLQNTGNFLFIAAVETISKYVRNPQLPYGYTVSKFPDINESHNINGSLSEIFREVKKGWILPVQMAKDFHSLDFMPPEFTYMAEGRTGGMVKEKIDFIIDSYGNRSDVPTAMLDDISSLITMFSKKNQKLLFEESFKKKTGNLQLNKFLESELAIIQNPDQTPVIDADMDVALNELIDLRSRKADIGFAVKAHQYKKKLNAAVDAVIKEAQAMTAKGEKLPLGKIEQAFPNGEFKYFNVILNGKNNKELFEIFSFKDNPLEVRLLALMYLKANDTYDPKTKETTLKIDTSAITKEFKDFLKKLEDDSKKDVEVRRNYLLSMKSNSDVRTALMGVDLLLSSGLNLEKSVHYELSDGAGYGIYGNLFEKIAQAVIVNASTSGNETAANSDFVFTPQNASYDEAAHEIAHNYLFTVAPQFTKISNTNTLLHELFAYAVTGIIHEIFPSNPLFQKALEKVNLDFNLYDNEPAQSQEVHAAAYGFLNLLTRTFKEVNGTFSYMHLAKGIIEFAKSAEAGSFETQSNILTAFFENYVNFIKATDTKRTAEAERLQRKFKLASMPFGKLLIQRESLLSNRPSAENPGNYAGELNTNDSAIAKVFATLKNAEELFAGEFSADEIAYFKLMRRGNNQELKDKVKDDSLDIKHRLYAFMILRSRNDNTDYGDLAGEFLRKFNNNEITVENHFDARAVLTGMHLVVAAARNEKSFSKNPENIYRQIQLAALINPSDNDNRSNKSAYMTDFSAAEFKAVLGSIYRNNLIDGYDYSDLGDDIDLAFNDYAINNATTAQQSDAYTPFEKNSPKKIEADFGKLFSPEARDDNNEVPTIIISAETAAMTRGKELKNTMITLSYNTANHPIDSESAAKITSAINRQTAVAIVNRLLKDKSGHEKNEAILFIADILNNAFVHGNSMDLSKNVQLYISESGNEIFIINEESKETPSLEQLAAATKYSMFGAGIGTTIVDDYMFARMQVNGKNMFIGSFLLGLSQTDKRKEILGADWKNPSELERKNYPVIEITGLKSGQERDVKARSRNGRRNFTIENRNGEIIVKNSKTFKSQMGELRESDAPDVFRIVKEKGKTYIVSEYAIMQFDYVRNFILPETGRTASDGETARAGLTDAISEKLQVSNSSKVTLNLSVLFDGETASDAEKYIEKALEGIDSTRPVLLSVVFSDKNAFRVLDNDTKNILSVLSKTISEKTGKTFAISSIAEILKNALLHGNSMDHSKPILVYFNGDNDLFIINEDLNTPLSLALQASRYESELSGKGVGTKMASGFSDFRFSRTQTTTANGQTVNLFIGSILADKKNTARLSLLESLNPAAQWQDRKDLTISDRVLVMPVLKEGERLYLFDDLGGRETNPIVYLTKENGTYKVVNVSNGRMDFKKTKFEIVTENGINYIVTGRELITNPDVNRDTFSLQISEEKIFPNVSDSREAIAAANALPEGFSQEEINALSRNFAVNKTTVFDLINSFLNIFRSVFADDTGRQVLVNYHFIKQSGMLEAVREFGNAAAITPEGYINLPVYVINDKPANHTNLNFANTGVSINGNPLWASRTKGAVVVYAEGASKDDISRAMASNRQINSLIKENAQKSTKTYMKNISIEWIEVDHSDTGKALTYSENGNIQVGYDLFKKMLKQNEMLNFSASLRKTKNVDGYTLAQGILHNLDDISEADDFKDYLAQHQKIGNGQIIINQKLAQNITDKFGERKFSEFLNAARKDGVQVFLLSDSATMPSKFEKTGFAGYVRKNPETGKPELYNYALRTAVEIKIIENINSPENLEQEITKAGTIVLLNNSDLRTIINSQKSGMGIKQIIDVLSGFKILKMFTPQKMTSDFALSAARNFDVTDMPKAEAEKLSEIAKLHADKNFQGVIRALNLPDSHPISVYITKLQSQTADVEVYNSFVTGITEKMFTAAELRKAYKDQGLQDKTYEIILGQALLKQAQQNTAGKGVSVDHNALGRTMKEAEEKLYETLQDLIPKAFTNNDPRAINAIAELIPAIAEERRKSLTKDDIRPEMNMKNYESILAAA